MQFSYTISSSDMQTGLSRTAHAADERKFVCVEIMKLINNQLNGSCVTRGPSMNVPHHMSLIRQLS